MRVIQGADLLRLADMGDKQLWMIQDIAESVNAEVERNTMTVEEITEAIERLAGILRGKLNG